MAALPETIILLHISFSRDKPYVADEERYDLICYDEVLGVYSLNLYFGYAEPITADHFDVTNSLRDVFESECYAALRKLTEERSSACNRDGLTRTVSNWARINARLTESMLLAPFEEFGTKATSSHWTYFLGVRKYIPHAKENVFTRLFVHTCDFLSRNSKSSRDFFGLTSVDTIEVSCVTVIRTKDHPPEGTEEEEMLELVGMDAREQA
jgi:K+ transporter